MILCPRYLRKADTNSCDKEILNYKIIVIVRTLIGQLISLDGSMQTRLFGRHALCLTAQFKAFLTHSFRGTFRVISRTNEKLL